MVFVEFASENWQERARFQELKKLLGNMDPLGDFLTIIKNGSMIKKEKVIAPFSKFKFKVAKLLEKEGFIKEARIKRREGKRIIEVFLAYDKEGNSKIEKMKRISKPGRRIYLPWKKIWSVKRGRGILIISTSKGIMTGKEAKKRKLGGEVISEIY